MCFVRKTIPFVFAFNCCIINNWGRNSITINSFFDICIERMFDCLFVDLNNIKRGIRKINNDIKFNYNNYYSGKAVRLFGMDYFVVDVFDVGTIRH